LLDSLLQEIIRKMDYYKSNIIEKTTPRTNLWSPQ